MALGGRQDTKSIGWPPSRSKGAPSLPIFYTTEIKKEGRSLDNPNVYFSKAGLAEWRAGPLRLFFKKLGRPLQNKLAGFG